MTHIIVTLTLIVVVFLVTAWIIAHIDSADPYSEK